MGICLNVVNEAYFGRTKDVKAIEEAISIARKPHLGERYNNDFFNDKKIMAVGDAIQKAFGFVAVDFNLRNDSALDASALNISRNIFTHFSLCSVKIDKSGKITAVNNPFPFNTYCVLIRLTTGLFYNDRFTDEEITALVLHEIGHTLQSQLSSGIHYLDIITIAANFIIAASTNKILQMALTDVVINPAIIGNINNMAKKNHFLSDAAKAGISIYGLYKFIHNNFFAAAEFIFPIGISNAINHVSRQLIKSQNNPKRMFNLINGNISGKNKEFNADEFAAMYGYGKELASALIKYDYNTSGTTIEEFRNKIPFYRNYIDLLSIPVQIIISPVSNHPTDPRRINNIINNLEKELKKSDLNPSMRKEIEGTIKGMKNLNKELSNMDDGAKIITRKWYDFMLKTKVGSLPVIGKLGSMDKLNKALEESADLVLDSLSCYDSDLYIRLESVKLI